ncbi:MAG: hypothetical protein M3O50_10245 [Myxococcota bacterium]|nr:hypothetical protein [Myxococcota bacterium]
MKSFVVLLSMVAAVGTPLRANARETGGDVESDHIDGYDDGGRSTVGFLLDPLAIALGRVGAEVDVMASDNVGVSFEGDWSSQFGGGYRASLGLPVFPLRAAFRALYVHPRVEWVRGSASGKWLNVVGAGATVGYEWTCAVGVTLRVGGGLAYALGIAVPAGTSLPYAGLLPEVDAKVGWVF